MGEFVVYILKSSFCLALFYLFYRLLFTRETFHRFNRIGILVLILLSVLIPFVKLSVEEPVIVQQSLLDLEYLLMMATMTGVEETVKVTPLWIRLLLWSYLLGSLVSALLFLYSCFSIFRIIRKGEEVQERLENGTRLIVTSDPVAPFSWMKWIVISRKDIEEGGKEIISHEMAHIQSRHSLDLLLAEICILFHWFNPAAWLFKQELQNIHEYEADEKVLQQGIDAKKYQLLLIKKAVGSQRFTSMANSFNHRSLKKRISMMLKRKSNPWARLKYVFVLPLAALAVAAFARPEISNELEKISSVKISEIVPIKEMTEQERVKTPVTIPDTVKVVIPDVHVQLDKIQMEDLDLRMEDMQVNLNMILAELEQEKAEVNADMFKMSAEEKKMLEEMIRLKEEEIRKIVEEKQIEIEKLMKKHEVELEKLMKEKQVEIEKIMKEKQPELEKMIKEKQPVWDGADRPLIIIDGVELEKDQDVNVPPEDIHTISVLKDSSASDLYGEKGINGVVLITTKDAYNDKNGNL